jgi:hypothetical protein
LRISGGGGKIHLLNSMLRSIKIAQTNGSKIIAEIIGEAYSAHAFLAIFADEIIFTPGSSLIFHHAAIIHSYLFGLISYRDMRLDSSDTQIQTNLFNQCVSTQLLTNNDIEFMKTGGDIVVTNREKKYVRSFWNILNPSKNA